MSYLTAGTGSADSAITWTMPFTWFNSGGTAWGTTYSATDPGANNMIIEGNVGIGTTNPSSFRLQVAGNVGPNTNNLYDLGSPALSWRNIYVSGTTAFNNVVYNWSAVQGGTNTYLKNDGSGNLTWATVAGASTPSWQEVTDVGATTTHWVWFAGATSSGDLRPSTTLMYDLGTSAYRWDDVWGQVFHVGSSTWDLYQDGNQDFVIDNRGLANLDNFNNNSIETYWTTSTPVGTFTESGEHLTVACAGVCDWYTGANESAPIIYQDLGGGDFIATVKMDSYSGAATTNAGIIAYLDRNNSIMWIRDNDSLGVWELVSDAAVSPGISAAVSNLPVWLRIRRVGTRIYFDYSLDGFSFITSGSIVQPFTPTKVGLMGKSWGGALTATFDSFELNENIAQVRISNTGTLLSGHHNGQDIGSFGNSWKNSYASGTYYGGYLNITGTSTLADLTPQAHNLYSIGENGNAFKNFYASGTVDTAHLVTEGTRVRGQIGIFNTSSTVPRDGVVVGNKLYMVNGTVFNIFDVSNPLKPALIGSATTSDGYQVAVQGNYAYIADNAAGLRIFNISNPYSPTYVTSSDISATSGCGDIELSLIHI